MGINLDPTGISTAIASASELIKAGIDRIWPNPTEETAAKVALLKAQVDAQVSLLDAQNRAAVAEASSADPWTSRARPSFLYVMYTLLLAGIPMGVVSAVNADTAHNIALGLQAWLAAIPSSMWDTMMVCFSVYSGGRTIEKIKGAAK